VEDYEKMFSASPIAYIKDKVAPALLLLGMKDRRVPPSQGLRWAEYLRSRKQQIQVMTFPEDAHPLDGFDAERVSFVASAVFFNRNLE
jgi:acylaminoacyl-peptidase